MDRRERQTARAERYRELAERAAEKATSAFEASQAATSGIEPGQPILVGHHSEAAHRRAVEKANSAMHTMHEQSEKAAYYQAKAEAAESNNNIYLGDDDAVERLEEKVARLTERQEMMKAANKAIRSRKSDDEKVAVLVSLGISRAAATAMVLKNTPFPPYMLSNNNAVLSVAKSRLEKAKALAGHENREYEIGDILVEECYSDNRLRLYFSGKPDEETRGELKNHGFRWAGSLGCWQSYINHRTIGYVNKLKNEYDEHA
jgi:hypothetical protein